MSDLSATIDTWLDAYGEPDETRRVGLIDQVWAPTGRLADPPFVGSGHAQINQLAAGVLNQFPGHRFRRTSGIDSHHNFARYSWEMIGPDGQTAAIGLDVAEVDDEGHLVCVVGFFGDLPPIDVAAGR